MKVIPAQGLKILDPRTKKPLPVDAEFEIRDHHSYWQRRLRDGDVIEVKAAEQPEAKSKTAAKVSKP